MQGLREHPIGEILPGVGIVFDEYNGVIPDLVFATHERMRKAEASGRFRAAPDIAIEILSPGSWHERRDRQVKRKLMPHEASANTGLWIRSITAWKSIAEMRQTTWCSRQPARRDELTSAFLPGFAVRSDTVFV